VNNIHVGSTVTMRMMLRKLATHIWPKDQPHLRLRVVGAMLLLIGAKVLPVFSPVILLCVLSAMV